LGGCNNTKCDYVVVADKRNFKLKAESGRGGGGGGRNLHAAFQSSVGNPKKKETEDERRKTIDVI